MDRAAARTRAWTSRPGWNSYGTDIKFITWGKETEFKPSFWNGVVQGTPLVEESWAVIWPEHLGTKSFEEGVDQAQLAADYQALTGSPLNFSPS